MSQGRRSRYLGAAGSMCGSRLEPVRGSHRPDSAVPKGPFRMPRMVSLRKRFAELIPELAKFGVVGLIGSVIDLGGAAYLHGVVGIGPLVSKGLSITAATLVTYLGSRFWTFRHRVNQALLREGVLFVVLNIIGLGIAEAVIAVTTYGLGKEGALAYNVASVVGTG